MPLARPLLLVLLASGPAWAQAIPVVHPIYVSVPGSPHDQQAAKMFADALARYRIGPVETMDLPAPPPPRAAELLRSGQAAFEKLKWPEAEAAFDAAVAEVLRTGGAGLEPAQLADLFLYQAIAAQRADWKDLTAPVKEIAPARAKQAYLRAATLTPDRVLAQHRFPPLAIASFALATAEVKQRPRGNLVVRAAPSAQVTIDAGQPLLAPATATGLGYGEHYVRVEDVGREPWAAVIPLTEQNMEIDAPAGAPLAVDDRAAAEHARRQGASYALVAQLKPGASPALDLRLLDAATGLARDATVVPYFSEAGALEAAVMRLDEEARKGALHGVTVSPSSDLTIATVPAAPPPAGPSFADDPGGWARGHWPLLTAIAATVGTAIVLGAIVSGDSRR